MPEDITHADRKSTNNEDYDTYDGSAKFGEIKDNPSVHIYIAHQIMDTVTEGEQYEPPEPTTPTGTEDPNATPSDATGDTQNNTTT